MRSGRHIVNGQNRNRQLFSLSLLVYFSLGGFFIRLFELTIVINQWPTSQGRQKEGGGEKGPTQCNTINWSRRQLWRKWQHVDSILQIQPVTVITFKGNLNATPTPPFLSFAAGTSLWIWCFLAVVGSYPAHLDWETGEGHSTIFFYFY